MEIKQLSRYSFIRSAPELVDIYIQAMGYDPSISNSRIEAWRSHTTHPGFTSVAAFEDGKAVGVAYGHAGTPMSWWHLQVQRGLHDRGKCGAEERRILANYFELSEIHVSPASQGEGIGAQLMLALLSAVRQPVVMLSTPEVEGENNRAFSLYRRYGFFDVLRHHNFVGDERPFAILGARLPLEAASPAPLR